MLSPRHRLTPAALFLCLALLAACRSSESLDQLDAALPAGDDYHTALASDYRDLAQENAAHGDGQTANYFAEKGLMAANGREVTPENPEQWDLPGDARHEFSAARGELLTAIRANRSTQPEMTAAAVTAYDRWLDAAHRDRDAGGIAGQRGSFYAVLARLSEAHTAATSVPPPTTTTPANSRSTVIYFPFDNDHFGDSAQGALVELARDVTATNAATVNINGHADRAGTQDYNINLSERRARFVLNALKHLGVPEKAMHYFAFGESDPAVPTADGVREPRNRRVEIFVE